MNILHLLETYGLEKKSLFTYFYFSDNVRKIIYFIFLINFLTINTTIFMAVYLKQLILSITFKKRCSERTAT